MKFEYDLLTIATVYLNNLNYTVIQCHRSMIDLNTLFIVLVHTRIR